MRTISTLLITTCCFALIMLAASVAQAASDTTAQSGNPDFSITSIDITKYPFMRLTFVKGDSSPGLPKFKVTENGSIAGDVRTYPGRIGQYEQNPKPVLMMAIDTSDSMGLDHKIENAKAAALKLIAQARPGDRIGLVTFGTTATVTRAPTSDFTQLTADISKLQLSHGTALYDGVWEAEHEFPSDASRRIVVLLSDGADSGSNQTAATVIKRAHDVQTEIYGVVLPGGESDPATITRLANSTSGSAETVASPSDLATTFTVLGRQLLRGYWMEYRSTQPPATTVKLTIEADGVDTITNSYKTPIIAGAAGGIKLTPPPSANSPQPLISLPGGVLGLLLTSLPFAALLAWAGIHLVLRRSRTPLDKRIEPFVRQRSSSNSKQSNTSRTEGLRGLLSAIFAFTDSILGKTSLFARFRRKIDQANLPLREVELLYIMIGSGIVGLLIALMIQPGLLIMFGVTLAMFALPYGWVSFMAKRRKNRFESQLADVLGGIAASLKAGHSFNQSMAAVIKEAPDPTAHEFQRVIAETRLGLPMELALEAMADRMGSVDFEFAVTTVNIQRTVGGSLSEILDMVADTVRNRQQFHKKVKALTSMGSMSAYVLLAMPIFMAGVLTLLSPSYMAPLWSTPTGHKMLMAGAVFMFLGWVSCKKIVTIKT